MWPNARSQQFFHRWNPPKERRREEKMGNKVHEKGCITSHTIDPLITSGLFNDPKPTRRRKQRYSINGAAQLVFNFIALLSIRRSIHRNGSSNAHPRTRSTRFILQVNGLGACRREVPTTLGALVTSTVRCNGRRSDTRICLTRGCCVGLVFAEFACRGATVESRTGTRGLHAVIADDAKGIACLGKLANLGLDGRRRVGGRRTHRAGMIEMTVLFAGPDLGSGQLDLMWLNRLRCDGDRMRLV